MPQAWTHTCNTRPVSLTARVRAGQLWGPRGLAEKEGASANASPPPFPRCWDLSSGHKKWIIQVPILASVVVSRGQGQCGHESND